MRHLIMALAAAGLTACGAAPAPTPLDPAPAGLAPAGLGPADQDFLDRYAATYRFRLGAPSELAVTADGGAVYFLRSGAYFAHRDHRDHPS